MSIEYSYEIVRVDTQARVMEIVYTSEGRQTMHIGARLPYEGESLEAIVQMYSPVAYWMEQEATVVPPQLGASGTMSPPAVLPMTLERAKSEKLADLAAWRYMREISGITLNGAKIRTDRESQATITGAFISLSQGLITSVDWKTETGAWIQLGLTEMTGIAQAVSMHVQNCFSLEKEFAVEIKALDNIEAVLVFDFPDIVI